MAEVFDDFNYDHRDALNHLVLFEFDAADPLEARILVTAEVF